MCVLGGGGAPHFGPFGLLSVQDPRIIEILGVLAVVVEAAKQDYVLPDAHHPVAYASHKRARLPERALGPLQSVFVLTV